MIVDALTNLSLTLLFLQAVRQLISFKSSNNSGIRHMAFRTFIGCAITLASVLCNITVAIVLDGERGWLCLMLCNIDTTVVVASLHWVSSIDASKRTSPTSSEDVETTITTRKPSTFSAIRPSSTRQSNSDDFYAELPPRRLSRQTRLSRNSNSATSQRQSENTLTNFDKNSMMTHITASDSNATTPFEAGIHPWDAFPDLIDSTADGLEKSSTKMFETHERKMFGGIVGVRTQVRRNSSALQLTTAGGTGSRLYTAVDGRPMPSPLLAPPAARFFDGSRAQPYNSGVGRDGRIVAPVSR
ncbi:hypothetical protein AAFC00_000788 [Neodothiora populina]